MFYKSFHRHEHRYQHAKINCHKEMFFPSNHVEKRPAHAIALWPDSCYSHCSHHKTSSHLGMISMAVKKWSSFWRGHFRIHYCEWTLFLIVITISFNIVGLEPIRQQITTSTNDDHVYWDIYTSTCGKADIVFAEWCCKKSVVWFTYHCFM